MRKNHIALVDPGNALLHQRVKNGPDLQGTDQAISRAEDPVGDWRAPRRERRALQDADCLAAAEAFGARLPKHLLYTSGWPTCVPSEEEAQLIAEVRQEVARILGITVGFTTTGDVISRYQELIAARQAKAR